MRLLLFDDDTSCTEVMAHYFEALGYELEVASELKQAETLVSDGSFDTVITDVTPRNLSGAGGLQLIEFIREHGIDTRVMVLTAEAAPEIRDRAMSLGAEHYFVKPVPLDKVVELLREGVPSSV